MCFFKQQFGSCCLNVDWKVFSKLNFHTPEGGEGQGVLEPTLSHSDTRYWIKQRR